ncbi:MAG: FecR domain-containing protein [Phycisphaerales bacterium]|jgi:ferric-dicitrate binding protein FerR (iron transport regulator)|nr:FecR domain-containing protein [Phycisphaerales bacterium]
MNTRDWKSVIARHLDGVASPDEVVELSSQIETDPETRKLYLQMARIHATLAADDLPEPSVEDEIPCQACEELPGRGGRSWRPLALSGIAAAVLLALAASFFFMRPNAEHTIAKITGLSGSLQWTGDGGRVFHNLSVGTELRGGTIEGMAPGSWFELEFNDGSTVTISGNSTLTFSDHGQKKLHLKSGGVSGDVKPQPTGKPMLIYTRTARLEVLGTQFEIDAELQATTLNVSEGTVRVKRLSDGSTVDVPAKHRIIAAADHKLLPIPALDSVDRWSSQLHLGPRATQGKWSPKTDTRAAGLSAIPYTSPQGPTIYTVGFGLSRGDKPPVIVQSGSRLRVRGRVASAHKVYFGVTVRGSGGQFAGRFQTTRPASAFQDGRDFEVVLEFRDFQLDPSLREIKSRLAGDPFGLNVATFWCHTLDKQAGLELTEVELIPPSDSKGI